MRSVLLNCYFMKILTFLLHHITSVKKIFTSVNSERKDSVFIIYLEVLFLSLCGSRERLRTWILRFPELLTLRMEVDVFADVIRQKEVQRMKPSDYRYSSANPLAMLLMAIVVFTFKTVRVFKAVHSYLVFRLK